MDKIFRRNVFIQFIVIVHGYQAKNASNLR